MWKKRFILNYMNYMGTYTHFYCLSFQSLNELCNRILYDHGEGVKERKNTQFHGRREGGIKMR